MFLIDVALHLDKYLGMLIESCGLWTYLIIFVIILGETGLVIAPFLPGDSLLFMVGVFANKGSLNLGGSLVLLIIASILGDALNYYFGNLIGAKVFKKDNLKFIKKEHLLKTQRFYEFHGGKTIIFARFLPIIRTCAPFIAGVAEMRYRKFLVYNVIGAILWVAVYISLGYFFYSIPGVEENFYLVILGVLSLSIIPITGSIIVGRKNKDTQGGQ